MSDTPVDSSKRTWLIASGCAGAVGGLATAVPFVSSFQPSERAKAAGAAVEVDISALKAGEMRSSARMVPSTNAPIAAQNVSWILTQNAPGMLYSVNMDK